MTLFTRRNFLQGMVLSVPYFYSTRCLNASASTQRLSLGCIGTGAQGRLDMRYLQRYFDITAICDVDTEYGLATTLELGYGRHKGSTIAAPDVYGDYRRLLDRNDIDAVMIATPDHWHTKIAMDALQAGKHVFCEKPLTLTVAENLLIRAAAEKSNRIFQVGTFQRAFRNQFMLAALIVRRGFLGDIKHIVCDIGGGPSSPEIPVASIPSSLNWDSWLGQAPMTDYLAADSNNMPWNGHDFKERALVGRGHFNFRWWYEYSGGKFTDWGAHHIDSALWILNYQKRNLGIISIDGTDSVHPVPFKNGFPLISNRYNTASHFNIRHTFDTGLVMDVVSHSKDGNGILFEGTKGRIHLSRGRIKGKIIEEEVWKNFGEDDYLALNNNIPFLMEQDPFLPPEKLSPGEKEDIWKGVPKIEDRVRIDFFHAFDYSIKHGVQPVCDVMSHVLALNLCHLSGIAARLKRKLQWDSLNETIIDDKEASALLSRPQRKGFEIHS